MFLIEKSACDKVTWSTTLMSSYKQDGNQVVIAKCFIFRESHFAIHLFAEKLPMGERTRRLSFVYFITRLSLANVSTSVE